MAYKTGLIDVGGGMRGIYACGVLDWCLENGVDFDVAIGVSAGSANISSFLAKQEGRNFAFYMEYSFRKQYMGLGNFLRKGSYIDLDYIYSTLSNAGGENPLDFQTLLESPTELFVVAADANTGHAKYFTKDDVWQDHGDIMKASSAIPFVCKPYVIDGIPYYDGALGDPVPVQKALDEGCDKIVLILTKPKDVIREPGSDTFFADRIKHRYPHAAESFKQRAKRYNEGVAFAKELEREGRLLIVAPDDTCGVDTLKRTKESMEQLYAKGLADAYAISDFLG